jgi:hypothetical protein
MDLSQSKAPAAKAATPVERVVHSLEPAEGSPGGVVDHVALGLAAGRMGRWPEARRELTQAKEAAERPGATAAPAIRSWDGALALALVRADVELGLTDEASSALVEAERLGAPRRRIEWLRAVVASMRPSVGAAAAAARRLERMLGGSSREVALFVDLGRAWGRAGNVRSAERAFARALVLAAGPPPLDAERQAEIHFFLAEASRRRAPSQARRAYARCLELAPQGAYAAAAARALGR